MARHGLHLVRGGDTVRRHLRTCTDGELLSIAHNTQAQIDDLKRFREAVVYELRAREQVPGYGSDGA